MEGAAARLTRQSGTSFYYAFRILPREKRQAIYALYSFCRVVDDCVDDPAGEGEAGLARWLEEARRCRRGEPTTELGRELARALARFPMPLASFEDIVDGCRMDLTTTRYRTFEELSVYCRRVASAVGLAAIEVFGYRNPATRDYARELGLALQLTNILRDVAPDAARGRLYVPLDDLDRFSVSATELLAAVDGGPRTAGIDALLAFQGGRARDRYARARELLPPEDRRAMLPAEIMAATYHAVLRALARRGYPLAGPRLRLSTPRKIWIAALTAVGSLLRR
jgi:phytoene synthase